MTGMHPPSSLAAGSTTLQGDLAGRDQRRAADPHTSVWVGASAGTGKTKVLTDRLLRLLLDGCYPERILCLTFTKAAAAEMANRLADQLARWASGSAKELEESLYALSGKQASFEEMVRARRLFARVLETPGGMRIQTIHSFCQSLLRRFPLEAGLAPHFSAIDDRDAAELMDEARELIFQRADGRDEPALTEAMALICDSLHETRLPDFLRAIAAQRSRLHRTFDAHGGLMPLLAAMAEKLGVSPSETAGSVIAGACQDEAFAVKDCRWAVDILLQGSKTDIERAQTMAAWLAADEQGRAAAFATYARALLTADGDVLKRLCTKKCTDRYPAIEDVLRTEAERMARIRDLVRAVDLRAATEAMLRFAEAWLQTYQRLKENRAQLDFDDLIQIARRLLNASSGRAAWVLYKLDGGIDHILIDEAQDTSPDQWDIVRALSDEFFAGAGAVETVRTVFAVGDPKQSIYSFQGADPKAFGETRLYLKERVESVRAPWASVPLQISFRSSPAVLTAVNATFAGSPGRDGVLEEGEDIHHVAWRSEDGGRVEIWPLTVPREVDAPPAWKPPVEAVRGDNSRVRLARLVAERIRTMISGEILPSKGRPVRAGDILVLVRRREPFVDDLVRELKSRRVPVAGNDRMVLTEQMAVMDLMALGNFLLLPEDDLTLAVVLRGPLIGLSEDDLFTLAWQRKGSLWDALRGAGDAAPFENAYRFLADLLDRADFIAPHELFSHVLTERDGRKKILSRLGAEAEDPLDEFMNLTLAFEQVHPPSLQGFLHWMESGAVEIKRDLEQAKGSDENGQVRIMTVHGSKGLQAPIVFMPDTVSIPRASGEYLFWIEDGSGGDIPLWPPHAEQRTETCRRAIEARKDFILREYRRLLYVAMTRAEDCLYVAGWQGKVAPSQGNWYELVRNALAAHPDAMVEDDPFLRRHPGEADDAESLVLTVPQKRIVDTVPAPMPARVSDRLPAWASTLPPREPVPPRPLVPSRIEGDDLSATSPLDAVDERRFQRGIAVHQLLQILPDVSPELRAAAAGRLLARPMWGMTEHGRNELIREVMTILDDPAFAPLFGPGSQAEVPIVGLVNDRALAGQVDRLFVSERDVWIVDYKTNRHPPATEDDVPPLYLRQMAAYRQALVRIYPDRNVHCVLLWTDGPVLMTLDSARLDQVFSKM